jgi:hypothetical protein
MQIFLDLIGKSGKRISFLVLPARSITVMPICSLEMIPDQIGNNGSILFSHTARSIKSEIRAEKSNVPVHTGHIQNLVAAALETMSERTSPCVACYG